MTIMTTVSPSIKLRSYRLSPSSRLVEVVPRLIAIAPTTPMAYSPESAVTLGKIRTTAAGTTEAIKSGTTGIPYRFRPENACGSSLSRESMNWIETRSASAVLTAESKSRAKTTELNVAKIGPT